MEERESTIESTLKVLHKQFQQIKLCQKDNSNKRDNPDIDPLNTMKDLIKSMIKRIDTLMIPDNPMCLRLLAMKTTLFYEQSKLLMSLGQEKLAQDVLVAALDGIKDAVSKPEMIFLTFRIINHYAYMLLKRGEYDKSRELLEFAESMYRHLKAEIFTIQFYASDDLFSPGTIILPSPDSNDKLERLVTNNLQMLAFVYNKEDLHDKFAEYHHEVLRRQLEMQDGNMTMWALKSARLASYFQTKNRFNEARHHLAAAVYVLYDYEKKIEAMKTTADTTSEQEELLHIFADIAKCWVKYGLSLFAVSKTNIISLLGEEPNENVDKSCTRPIKFKNANDLRVLQNSSGANKKVDKNTEDRIEDLKDTIYEKNHQQTSNLSDGLSNTLSNLYETMQRNGTSVAVENNIQKYEGSYLLFPSLNLEQYEEQVAVTLVETTSQAQSLFLYTDSWLKRAKAFYTLHDHPMEYVNTILDASELYKYLAFFEEDIEAQYAIQKLRIDALETLSIVLKEIRPQCYMEISIELLRELAEVQLEMMGLNLRRIYVSQDMLSEKSDVMIRKMQAVSDIHSKLEASSDNFGHNVNPVSGSMSVSDIVGDVFQYFDT